MEPVHIDVDGWSGFWPGPFEFVWGFLALAGTIAFWSLVILLLVKLVRSGSSTSTPTRSSALQVLEERYARGEITREEYFERRAVLSGQTPPGSTT